MNRTTIVLLALIILAGWRPLPAQAEKTNIVYIMADELGYFELSCMGHPHIKTPRIDQMAKEGLRFTQALAGSSLCAPTRAVLMTGKHTGHTSVRTNGGGTPLRAGEKTIASILKEAGYATGGFGKWGCGGRGSTGVPEEHGFDTFVGYYDQVHAHSYYPAYLIKNSQELSLEGNQGGRTGKTYSHYRIVDEAKAFIKENKDGPFFCYLPVTPPHGMFDIPDDDPAWKLYADKPWPEPARRYAAMITMLDRQVGEILDLLAELALDEKTLVFFCGDNGGNDYFKSRLHPRGFHAPNVDPQTKVVFRGTKGSLYEGGLRIPMIARWPKKVEAGGVSDHLWYFPDVLPTLAEVAGAPLPDDLDGLSVLPALIGAQSAGREAAVHPYLYWELGARRAVRTGSWKAIRAGRNSDWALYDLSNDVSETEDLADRHPERLASMVAFAEKASSPAVEGSFADRGDHEKDRAAKWGPGGAPVRGRRKVNKLVGEDMIPRGDMKLVRVSSQNESNAKLAGQAFDEDPRTIWHTRFSGGLDQHPHEIVFDLGAHFDLTGFRYLARQDTGWNGAIKGYELLISDSPDKFETLAKKGELRKTKEMQTVTVSPHRGRYVLLRTLSEVNGGPWASVAEIAFTGTKVLSAERAVMHLNTRHPLILVIGITLLLGVTAASSFAQHKNRADLPDLTKGGAIPKGWTHDWNLGPTGARGWIYCDKHVTSDARQILLTEVTPGSPASGVLRVGDVILGIDGKAFEGDARVLFGKAITEAERKKNGGRLRLTRWRKGKTRTVTVKLRPLGGYGDTAPYDCAKSKTIFERGCKQLAANMKEEPTKGHPITRALNALALLASGDKKFLPVVREQVRLLSLFNQSSGVRTWQYAYINILLAEYFLATNDRRFVDKGLRRITQMIVDGQSAVGSWGHDFVRGQPKRLGGYGMMNAPGIPLTYSLVLAQRAQVKVPGLSLAIKKSKALLRFYVGKGSIPYGDHRPWIETHCDNGKNEMAAVLFDLEGEAPAAEYFSRMAVASHGAERDSGHTGNFFNMTWAMLGVARSGPHATGAWMKEFGWYYDLARRWDGTYRYQGAPTPRPESYDKWDCTGAYLLAYAQPLKKIYLTGRQPSTAPSIDRATAESLIKDGRGWSNKDRKSFYQSLGTDDLLPRLESWSPVVRERAAIELGKRREIVPRLIKLLGEENLYARLGACRAIHFQGKRGAPAIDALQKTLEDQDLWLRIQATEALAGIGKPARVVVPQLLARLNNQYPPDDPRGMEQRFLTMALFNRRDGLIGKSLEGVDQELLVEGVRASLTNQDGRARGAVASVYQNLRFEQLEPLLPAILDAIATPAPSGIMFADGIRTAGLELFARHRVDEGIELLADYARHQKQHGSQKRIVRILELLKGYGGHARRVIPQLKETADFFEKDEKNFPRKLSLGKARVVRETIKKIKASKDFPKLISLKSSKE